MTTEILEPNLEAVWLETETVSTQEFDQAVIELSKAQEEHDAIEKVLAEASQKKEGARSKLLALMEKSGKSKYQLDGYGSVSRTTKYSVTTPKDNDSKELMINHFRNLGKDFELTYLSVNSAQLNSYFNSNKEINPDFLIPGVGEPTVRQSIRFTKEKKKA